MSPAEVAQQQWEALHPPRETDAFHCQPCDYEYEVAEGQDATCPICQREGKAI